VLQIPGAPIGKLKRPCNDDPTGDLQMAAD
jgi:hypothetical protein